MVWRTCGDRVLRAHRLLDPQRETWGKREPMPSRWQRLGEAAPGRPRRGGRCARTPRPPARTRGRARPSRAPPGGHRLDARQPNSLEEQRTHCKAREHLHANRLRLFAQPAHHFRERGGVAAVIPHRGRGRHPEGPPPRQEVDALAGDRLPGRGTGTRPCPGTTARTRPGSPRLRRANAPRVRPPFRRPPPRSRLRCFAPPGGCGWPPPGPPAPPPTTTTSKGRASGPGPRLRISRSTGSGGRVSRRRMLTGCYPAESLGVPVEPELGGGAMYTEERRCRDHAGLAR